MSYCLINPFLIHFDRTGPDYQQENQRLHVYLLLEVTFSIQTRFVVLVLTGLI